MPRKAVELSALFVKRLTRPGLFSVGGVTGLALQVQPTGGRSWILRITANGARREIGLGGYPDVSLSLARDLARQPREAIARGGNPVAERRERKRDARRSASQVTFEDAAVRWPHVRSQ